MKSKASLLLLKTNKIKHSNGEFDTNPYHANVLTSFHVSMCSKSVHWHLKDV